MAESLSSERTGSNGPDRGGFLDLVDRHEAIDDELAAHQETVRSIRRRRKDLRKLIAAEGHDIDEFDRALRDAQRSGEEREAADRAYRRNMEWLGKPVGYQTTLDLAAAPPAEMGIHELKRVDREGYDAGKRGDRADSCSYTPGTEAAQRWKTAWLRGQAEKVTDEIQPPEEAPRRRGRPPGSGKRQREAAPASNGEAAGFPPNDIARSLGRADGLAGHRDHAARYASGEAGQEDYDPGQAEGKGQRQPPAPGDPAIQPEPPPAA